MIEKALASIVVTAQAFNPSIFSEKWLNENGLVDLSALSGVRLFSPEIAQFQTEKFSVLTLSPKLQVSFDITKPEKIDTAPRQFVGKVVRLLPHTPFLALGINFDFFVSQQKGDDFGKYCQALFSPGNSALLKEFHAPDVRFGQYLSKNIGNARLKLDAKPVRIEPEKRELLQFSFNFHHDLATIEQNTRADELHKLLDTWESLYAYAMKLVAMGS